MFFFVYQPAILGVLSLDACCWILNTLWVYVCYENSDGTQIFFIDFKSRKRFHAQ